MNENKIYRRIFFPFLFARVVSSFRAGALRCAALRFVRTSREALDVVAAEPRVFAGKRQRVARV